MESILKRRSIRRYKDEPVEPALVDQILEAAFSAPSSNNEQPWHFIVIRDRDKLAQVPTFHPYSAMIPKAQLAILVCADPSLANNNTEVWIQDCSAATENLLIAVASLGLGAVWLGVHPSEERIVGCRNLFQIPDNIAPFALVPVGWPAEEKGRAKRKTEGRVHYDRW